MDDSSTPAVGPSRPTEKSVLRQVLLIEDNLLVCMALRGSLEEAGFGVTVIDNGDDAWERLQTGVEPPDIVLSDLMLPGLSGRELLLRMQTLPRRIPVVVITGLSDRKTEEEVLGLGAAAVIGKPFRPADLIGTIRWILGLP